MIYRVTARFIDGQQAEFLRILTNGTVEQQRPDGREIVASMQRATIGGDGAIHWSERCYCATPLHHERTTVYDRFFTDIATEEIDDYETYDGESFMAWLESDN